MRVKAEDGAGELGHVGLGYIVTPAARSLCATGASAVAGGALTSTLEPARVGSPVTSNKSLMGWEWLSVESSCAIIQTAGRGDPEWGWKMSAATLFGRPSIALAQ